MTDLTPRSDRLRKLADFLEHMPHHDDAKAVEADCVDMNVWCTTRAHFADCEGLNEGDCGTVACIAGHAVRLFGDEDDLTVLSIDQYGRNIVSRAAKLLHIEALPVSDLFFLPHVPGTVQGVKVERLPGSYVGGKECAVVLQAVADGIDEDNERPNEGQGKRRTHLDWVELIRSAWERVADGIGDYSHSFNKR